jgi:hypothetical protein
MVRRFFDIVTGGPVLHEAIPLNQRGSIAVTVAVILITLVGLLAFSLNTGRLYAEKNQFQLAVEAAAMAGAAKLCDNDPESIARQVAIQNGIPEAVANDATQLLVQIGVYDASENAFHESEGAYYDAVQVELEPTERTLLIPGFIGGDSGSVSAHAVAYIEHWGLASLNESGGILIQRPADFFNGDMFASGDIKMAGSSYRPTFTNSEIYARGAVLECKTKTDWTGAIKVDCSSVTQSSLENAHSEADRTIEIRPINEESLEEWKATADIVYTPDQAGEDDIFFGACQVSGQTEYFFDLSEERSERLTIFFDSSGEDDPGKVYLSPKARSTQDPDCKGSPDQHSPNGSRVQYVTFVTNAPVYVDDADWANKNEYHFGAEGDAQVIVITSENIRLYSTNIYVDGAVFRCGGDFSVEGSGGSAFPTNFRAVADGDITVTLPSADVYFDFGPPCPPVIVGLAGS